MSALQRFGTKKRTFCVAAESELANRANATIDTNNLKVFFFFFRKLKSFQSGGVGGGSSKVMSTMPKKSLTFSQLYETPGDKIM